MAAAGGEGEGEGEVKVLGGWASPFAMRPRVALNIKGVKYEVVEETLGSKSELLLESNPVYKKIPVLLHADNPPVSESMIIVQYIDEVVWPGRQEEEDGDGRRQQRPAILPSHPYHRALARFWAAYIDDKWYPSLGGIFRAETDEAKAEAVSQVFAGLQLLEEAFESSSSSSNGKGGFFFGGEAIGYLDIALGCHLGWLRATGKMTGVEFLDEAKTPLLVRWAERFCSDDAVKEVMPEADTLVDFANVLMARFKSAPPAADAK